jgi:hypothetical protein
MDQREGCFIHWAIDLEFKALALSHAGDGAVTQSIGCAFNSLALRVKDF